MFATENTEVTEGKRLIAHCLYGRDLSRPYLPTANRDCR
jgi:hypothetical protein